MQRLTLGFALIGLCIYSTTSFAQSSVVELCVASLQVAGTNASDAAGRDQLIKFLNKEKPDKALPTEFMAIPQAIPEEALAFAKQKGCQYVVTTNQAEMHSDSSWWGGGTSGVNMQTFFVTTTFKLTKVSDGSEVASGSFKASDKGSEQNAVGFTMKKVADKVTEAIKKGGPIASAAPKQ
jgi:hypothetical protein